MSGMELFISLYIKLFFLLAPFFVLTVFLSMTKGLDQSEQRRIAVRVTLAVIVISVILYFVGREVFDTLGITLDAFRIGAGSLLFLSAVSLVKGQGKDVASSTDGDFSVVPLAMPVTVGPATIGALLVMGAALHGPTEKAIGCAALLVANLSVGVILYLASPIERLLGRMGINILTKLTGLVLSALSAQIIFTGIRNFMK